MPDAATEKLAVCPAFTVWAAGCEVIEGATAEGALIVSDTGIVIGGLPAPVGGTTICPV